MPVLCRKQRKVRPQTGGGGKGTREEVTMSFSCESGRHRGATGSAGGRRTKDLDVSATE
jgi:hypothetical protein